MYIYIQSHRPSRCVFMWVYIYIYVVDLYIAIYVVCILLIMLLGPHFRFLHTTRAHQDFRVSADFFRSNSPGTSQQQKVRTKSMNSTYSSHRVEQQMNIMRTSFNNAVLGTRFVFLIFHSEGARATGPGKPELDA